MASKIVVGMDGKPLSPEQAVGGEEVDFKNSMILNLKNQLEILNQRVLMVQHLIHLVESSEHVAEFAKIMQDMQMQGK